MAGPVLSVIRTTRPVRAKAAGNYRCLLQPMIARADGSVPVEMIICGSCGAERDQNGSRGRQRVDELSVSESLDGLWPHQ